MQFGPKIDEIWPCACIAYITIYCFSRFLDVANTSSVPHMLRKMILLILLFYRTFLSSLEAEKCVEFYFSM